MAEIAVFDQILNHFLSHQLFHPNHHGSLPGHSTATALIQIFDYCLEAAEKQELTAVCLLDQSASYDLICHKTLEEKLKLYSFSDAAIDWVMSNLGGRTQCVQVESRISEQLPCGDFGIPQGSVLAGLLHVIFCNDFPACHQEAEAVLYVDDDSDTVSDCDPKVLKDKIETEAGLSVEWLKDNRLCVAADKSKLLIIGTPQLKLSKLNQADKMNINVDGKIIEESSSEKILGIIVNNTLTWKNHLYGDNDNPGLIPQLSKRVGMLRRLSKHIDKKQLKEFTSGIFYSKLNYCLPVFGNVFGVEKYKENNRRYMSFTVKDNNKIQTLQNEVNRLLLDADPLTPTADLLRLTNSLSVHQLTAYQTAAWTHKVIQSGKPVHISNKIKPRQTNLSLRHGGGVLSIPQ